MSRPQIWPWLKPFLVLVVVVAIPPLTYWFVYVQHTVDTAKQQAYSTLAAVATNFKDRVAAHDQIAITAQSSSEPGAYLQSVLQPRSTSQVPIQELHLAVGEDSGGLLVHVGKIAHGTIIDEGRPAQCQLANGCSLRAIVALENLIPWQIVQPEFDGLLVLSENGHLLAQDRRLPMQALGIRMPIQDGAASLDYKQILGDAAPSVAKNSPLTPGSLFDFRAERSIQIAGVDYLVFVQPATVLVTPVERTQSSGEKHLTFLLCGLVRKDRLRSDAIKLSPQTLTLAGSLVALGLFSIPFLKLRFIGARERMRRRDIWLLCASLLCTTALLVLLMLDRHTRDKLHDRFDHGLRQFTFSVTKHLSDESHAAVAQLQSSASQILQSVPRFERGQKTDGCGAPTAIGSILASPTLTSPPMANMAQTLPYPDFEAIYVTDKCGNQMYKWMPRTTPTPNVPALTQPFYAATFALQDSSFAYSSLIARTSGLLLGIFTQPLDLNTRQFGPQVKFVDRTGIVAIATPLRSVNAPVTPQPFQFVLINRQGEVTFQQAQGPFRGERFFAAIGGEQSLQLTALDNARLDPSARLTVGSIIGRNYRGRAYRMHAVDIPELQQTLVAYYDEATVDSLAARIFGTAALFSIALIACILIGAVLAVCWFGEHAHDWLWPSASRTWIYWFGALLCSAAMIALVLVRTILPANIMAALLMLAPIVALIALGSGRVASGLGRLIIRLRLHEGFVANSRSATRAYQTLAVTGLLAFIAGPTALIADDAFTLHTAAYTSRVVSDLNMAIDKSQSTFVTNVINVGTALPPLNCKLGVDKRCMLPERTYATQSNYDALISTRNEYGVYRDCVNLQTGSGETGCASVATPWSFTVGVANRLAHFSKWPDMALTMETFSQTQRGLSATPILVGFTFSTWSVGGCLLLIAALSLLIGSVAKHVLGIGLTNRLALDESSELQPVNESRWLLLRPSSHTLMQCKQHASTHIDLRDALAPSFTPPSADTILLIHHIEARIAHPDWRNALLALLDSPMTGCVVLSSEIDPLHYLINRLREAEDALTDDAETKATLTKSYNDLHAELASWSIALQRVRKIRNLPPSIVGARRGTDSNAARLIRECACTEPLIEIGNRLGKLEQQLEEYRWGEIVGFVLDAAEPYYHSIWELCSHEEQLVLIQLAQEGLVNPKRIDIVQRLARRSLVSVDPRFKLMNESFRCFVRTAESPERIADWERTPASSAWSRLGMPLYALAAVIIAILLFTEQETFSGIIAVATGAAGALGSMRNLYASAIKPAVQLTKNG